jgi:hypothetical protein
MARARRSAKLPVMITATAPGCCPVPEVAQDAQSHAPGVYVTDGTRLLRVVSPGGSLFPCAELEDCQTLEVERYFSDELYAMRLKRIDPSA